MMLKALIVDDEYYIRKGLLNKIDWEEMGIQVPAEANDGIEAMEYIQNNHVDIVLTDIKMPEMDGIKFIEEVKRKFGDRYRFIIISGYGEFEYARKAMKFGVSDFLLKPIKEDELEEVIRKNILDISKERKEREYKKFLESNYKKNRILLKDKLMNELLKAGTDDILCRKNIEILDVEFPFDNFMAAIIKIDSVKCLNTGFKKKDRELISFAVRNILEEIFSKFKYSIVFKSNRNDREFVVVCNFEFRKDKDIVKRLCLESIAQIDRCLNIDSVCGIGECVKGLAIISRSYSQAEFALKERLLKGAGKIYDVSEVKRNAVSSVLFDGEQKKLLKAYFQEGKKESIIKSIDGLFKHIMDNPLEYNHVAVHDLCLELYIFLNNLLKDNDNYRERVLKEKYKFIELIMGFESMERVLDYMKDCFERVFEYTLKNKNSTGEEIVRGVKNYIDLHYYEEISLGFISNKFHIHPNYFCRIFKDIVGENFSDYLTGVRMRKAGELLKNSDLGPGRVSEIIGYEDPRYFSQVFKRHFGITPSEYQSTKG